MPTRYVQFESGTSIDTIVDSMKGFMLLDVPMGVCKAIISGPLPEGMKSLDGLPPVAPSTASPSQTRPTPQAAMSNSVSPASKHLHFFFCFSVVFSIQLGSSEMVFETYYVPFALLR